MSLATNAVIASQVNHILYAAETVGVLRKPGGVLWLLMGLKHLRCMFEDGVKLTILFLVLEYEYAILKSPNIKELLKNACIKS